MIVYICVFQDEVKLKREIILNAQIIDVDYEKKKAEIITSNFRVNVNFDGYALRAKNVFEFSVPSSLAIQISPIADSVSQAQTQGGSGG